MTQKELQDKFRPISREMTIAAVRAGLARDEAKFNVTAEQHAEAKRAASQRAD